MSVRHNGIYFANKVFLDSCLTARVAVAEDNLSQIFTTFNIVVATRTLYEIVIGIVIENTGVLHGLEISLTQINRKEYGAIGFLRIARTLSYGWFNRILRHVAKIEFCVTL